MNRTVPLVVDLDGSLLCSDLLLESGMAFTRQHPLRCWQPLSWLQKGKARLKEKLAESVHLDVSTLPYNPDVLTFLQKEKNRGRMLVLATASHRLHADAVAQHLQLFDEVLATENGHNLSAENKRDALVERFGKQGFDYIGNSSDDLPVWSVARKALLVKPPAKVLKQAQQYSNVDHVFDDNSSGISNWPKAMRLHQWLKNLLIFVPLLATHSLFNGAELWHAVVAFLAFGLTASSVYLLNDLLDLADDRQHPSKYRRPFASGTIPLVDGLIAIPLLLLASAGLTALFLPWEFMAVLLTYYGLTLLYSFKLKRHSSIDVISLAALYTLRIIAGAAALALPLTFWILSFSMFLFLSLALVKRYAELHEAFTRNELGQTRGRGYFPDDMPIISTMGIAAGYLSVLVLALYIHDLEASTLYTWVQSLWLTCPLLLLWITRIWLLTHRGQMHEDPVVFAARDRFSGVIAVLFLLAFWVAV